MDGLASLGLARLQAPDADEPARAETLPAWADQAVAWVARIDWTAADLASLGLPAMPSTEYRMREWLAREGCASRDVALPSGGRALLWHRTSFPSWLRQAIDRRIQQVLIATGQSSAAVDEAKVTRSQQQLARLSPKLAQRAEARAEILDAWTTWRAGTGRFGWRGQVAFCAAYAAGTIAVSEATRGAVPRVCAASLSAWAKRRADGGLAALAGDYRPPPASMEAEPELVATAEAAIAEFPHIRASHLRDVLTARCPDVEVPHLRSVQRWLAGWKQRNRQALAHLKNPDAHRSRFRPAFGEASAAARAPNDEWQADASPADIVLADGKRYALIGIIDVATRRLRLHVAPSSSGIGISLVLRRCLLDFGVPLRLVTDNGADFTGRHVARVLRDLEIEHQLTPPFSPERKPYIERAFRTFAHDLVEMMPGYVGHDVAERQALRARASFADRLMGKAASVALRLSPAEFQAFCDRWCADRYEHRVHGGLRATPALAAARHTGALRRIADERALDILLAPVAGDSGRRTVTKKGIRLEGGNFIAAELGSLVGEVVECRADFSDAGRIWVFDADGRFVCVAVDPERTGVSRQAIAEAAKRQAAADLAARKQAMREAGKGRIDRDTIARDILNANAEAARRVVAFPARTEIHAPDALAQAAAAARAQDAPAPPPRTEADARAETHLVDLTTRLNARRQAASAQNDRADAAARIARGMRCRDALLAGMTLGPDELDWFRAYEGSSEFRTVLVDRFGIDIRPGRYRPLAPPAPPAAEQPSNEV